MRLLGRKMLGIQLYESTLVSDDSRFDRYMDGDSNALSSIEKDGMALFTGKANCVACHNGPELHLGRGRAPAGAGRRSDGHAAARPLH